MAGRRVAMATETRELTIDLLSLIYYTCDLPDQVLRLQIQISAQTGVAYVLLLCTLHLW